MYAKSIAGLLLLGGFVFFCGCSPQKTLAHRLRTADHVVVTNTLDGFAISVKGKEVDKILRAIAAAKKESPMVCAAAGVRLEFYNGTEHVETLFIANSIFWIGNQPYRETTDTFNGILPRLRRDMQPEAH